jgi:hypothetical protein
MDSENLMHEFETGIKWRGQNGAGLDFRIRATAFCALLVAFGVRQLDTAFYK